MRDIPLLMNGAMVLATLRDDKTQTRRLLKTQPAATAEFCRYDEYGNAIFTDYTVVRCPYEVGMRLWVRETWRFFGRERVGVEGGFEYRADLAQRRFGDFQNPKAVWDKFKSDWDAGKVNRWRSSLHMERWASRITLEIADVRVERVQEISEADAISEGSYLGRCQCLPRKRDRKPIDAMFRQTHCITHGQEFRSLWDSINGKRPGCDWKSNPWVLVIGFRRIGGGA